MFVRSACELFFCDDAIMKSFLIQIKRGKLHDDKVAKFYCFVMLVYLITSLKFGPFCTAANYNQVSVITSVTRCWNKKYPNFFTKVAPAVFT